MYSLVESVKSFDSLLEFLEAVWIFFEHLVFLARDVIYTSRAYATMSMSVCPSVCDGSAWTHYS